VLRHASLLVGHGGILYVLAYSLGVKLREDIVKFISGK